MAFAHFTANAHKYLIVLRFYALTCQGKSIDVHASSLLMACAAKRLRSAARVQISASLMSIQPKIAISSWGGRAVLRGAGRRRLAEPPWADLSLTPAATRRLTMYLA